MRSVIMMLGVVAFSYGGVSVADAQSVTAVKPVTGFICMNLAMTHDQAVDRSFSVPVYASPSLQAQRVGSADAVPFIKAPLRPDQKFQEMLWVNGQAAWIETKWLEPWSSPAHPSAVCAPWLMSNGRIGARTDTNR